MIIVALAAMSFTIGNSILLRLNLKEGSQYTIRMKATMLTTMNIQGQSINSNQTIEASQSLCVKKASDNENILESEIQTFKMSQSQMGMNFSYDSEHPEKASPMIAAAAKGIENDLHKPFTITFDNCGTTSDINEELSINYLRTVVMELPKDEIQVGSTWSNTTIKDLQGQDVEVAMTYTVKEITKKNIVINIDGDINSTEGVTGTYEGTATISIQTGLVTSCSMKQNISMTMSEQGLSIPMTISGSTNTTLE